MDINSILSMQNTASTNSTPARNTTGELGKDEFLKILIAQMQNQDPTSPMDNGQFISQMAQFSALEQMQQLNTSMQYSQAYSLLGKNVSATVTNSDGTTTTVSGMVSGVTTYNNVPYLYVNGNLLSIDAGISVFGQDADQMLLQGSSMIGKYITGTYQDSQGVSHDITGKVDRLEVKDGALMLYVGSQPVYLADVTGVSDTAPAPAG